MAIAEKVHIADIQKELEEIRQAGGGILYPKDVVAYAENPDTALHSQFDWDDTEAAYKYRLWQARQFIRAVVTVIPSTNKTIEAYVSLKSDRSNEGGYRALAEVLSDSELKKQLLADALGDFELWENKYNQIQELVPIFKAAKKVRQKL